MGFPENVKEIQFPCPEEGSCNLGQCPLPPCKIAQEYRENCADRFALDFLPPYSPDLNPIERVWKLTRRLCTHNRYSPTLENVSGAVEATFDEWVPGSDILRRLCAIN